MTKFTVSVIVSIVFITCCCNTAKADVSGTRNVTPDGGFSFQLESNGWVLPTYNHRGRTYVEGAYGDTYQIRVINNTGERIEAVVTVDGRDVVSGQVGDYIPQRGYVIDPYDSVLIEGFRTSYSDVAEFSFTDVGDSYASRMGDATNVGVIGVAVFLEKVYRRLPEPLAESKRNRIGTRYDRKAGGASAEKSAPSASSEPRGDGYNQYSEADDEASQGLGTRYGDSKYSPATRTQFTRQNYNRPNHLLAVRYDDRQGLISRGVIPRPPRPYHRHERPNPFPGSPYPQFAPPPPRYDYE